MLFAAEVVRAFCRLFNGAEKETHVNNNGVQYTELNIFSKSSSPQVRFSLKGIISVQRSKIQGSEIVPGQDSLLSRFHIGWYRPSGCQALKTLVGVIDENPVFILVVSLWMITCGDLRDKEIKDLISSDIKWYLFYRIDTTFFKNLSDPRVEKKKMLLPSSIP